MQRKARIVALATTAVFAAGAAPAAAETVVGLTDTDKLVAFDSASPGTVTAAATVTGLTAGDDLVGIDYRPATLQLYALGENGDSGQLYRIDPLTGAAVAIGARFDGLDSSSEYDIDFNPTIDRLRVTSEGNLSLVVNPNNGAAASPAPPALNPGDPTVVGSAYDNNHPASGTYPAAPTTKLYAIDAGTDQLLEQNAATSELSDAQDLGVDVANTLGFDISTGADSADTGYIAVRAGGSTDSTFHTINLDNGDAGPGTAIGGAEEIADIAVAPPSPALIVLGSGTAQTLSIVFANRPDVVTPGVPITGLQTGEKLLGIDTRPSDGKLFGLGSTSRLYTIDALSGVATQVGTGTFTPAVVNEPYGFDFNPTMSSAAIRLLAGTANSALNATTAAHTPATAAAFADGTTGDLDVRMAAYTKEVSGGTPPTRLFGIDVAGGRTVEIGQTEAGGTTTPPTFNGGQTTLVGDLGVDPVSGVGGLEAIDRFDQQFAALETTAGRSTLFTINGAITAMGPRANGSAAAVGDLGLPSGTLAEGIAVLTAGSTTQPQPTPSPTPPYTVPTPTPTPSPEPSGKARVALKGVKVTPKRDRTRPYRFRIRGVVDPVGRAKRVASGRRVRIVVKRSGSRKIRINTRARVANTGGRFTKRITIRRAKRQLGKRRGRISVRVKYLGNSELRSSAKKIRSVKYGRRR